MGLTIGYTLRLPGELPESAVVGILERLREHAGTMGFANVSAMFHMAPGEEVPVERPHARPGENYFRVQASLPPLSEPECDEHPLIHPVIRREDWGEVATELAMGFTVDPGDGCELATFGFRAPRTPELAPAGGTAPVPRDWLWDGWCKTQYASNLGEEHFVRCHTGLVSFLDSVPRFGIRLEVGDEGGYWEHRDVPRLLAELRRANLIMARFTQELTDRLPPGTPLEASILEHPDYEELQAWRPMSDDEIERAVQHDLELLEFDDDDEPEWLR